MLALCLMFLVIGRGLAYSHTLSSQGTYRLEMINARFRNGRLSYLIDKRPVMKGSGHSILVSYGQTLSRKALSIRDDKCPRLSSLIHNALRKRVWPRETNSIYGLHGNAKLTFNA